MEYWTAFLLGLAGSAHCAGMCGPLALALPAVGASRGRFFAGRAAYNLGRLLTYSLLGAIFGLVGQTLLLAGVQRWVSIALGAALLMGLFSSRQLGLLKPVAKLVDRLKGHMGALLRQRSLVSLLVLGTLNGLLPCGLVYVACAGATATNHPASGAEYMALFGLGTVPMLLVISISGRFVPIAWRVHLRKAVPVSIFIVASMLILRGMSLGIPYLSPDLSAAGLHDSNCCAPH
jgi:sulfite exporter TauE/SafE